MIERVNPPELGKPSGYSHAVAVNTADAERIVFLAGQTALNDENKIVGDGVVEQFEKALGNLLAALRGAGGEPKDLVSVTIYIVDMDDYKAHAREIGSVWRALVGTEYPAMAGIGVSRLWDVEALVEVQGFAAVPMNRGQEDPKHTNGISG
ncbi:RidA family protein [Kibdelosporangium aridum]|uniref:Enamine deaminase RidA, house cleaning of reactive enamine intermediates, YjgF/YER057c/UK114 family n=1 Tax=Kibdelosporangium aridum TaxID=2030 RepID=A0A1Y5Y5P9_KIBAR|nr:RidA family protein [Kibdelosporangium aridum]SMD26164.1 Enamine deaminase RidA, house cleaning of reactive enamine intermediates, YjgF/YER057c/UK114 family [Kibdelosporangium aridum]